MTWVKGAATGRTTLIAVVSVNQRPPIGTTGHCEGSSAFVKVTFPFGPAGNQLEITTYDLDGSLRNSESFTKVDERQTSG